MKPVWLGRLVCRNRRSHSEIAIIRPVVMEARGIGAGDRYLLEGFGRYYCRTCEEEIGTGDFSATITAELKIDAERFPEILGPPLGPVAMTDESAEGHG